MHRGRSKESPCFKIFWQKEGRTCLSQCDIFGHQVQHDLTSQLPETSRLCEPDCSSVWGTQVLRSRTMLLCAGLCPGGGPKIRRRLSVENKPGCVTVRARHNLDRHWSIATCIASHALCDNLTNEEFFVCLNLHLGFTQSEESVAHSTVSTCQSDRIRPPVWGRMLSLFSRYSHMRLIFVLLWWTLQLLSLHQLESLAVTDHSRCGFQW